MNAFRLHGTVGFVLVAVVSFAAAFVALRGGTGNRADQGSVNPSSSQQVNATGELPPQSSSQQSEPTQPAVSVFTGLSLSNKLKWKFKVGDRFYVETVEKVKQTGNTSIGDLDRTETSVVRYRVLENMTDGAVLEMQRAGRKVVGRDRWVEVENKSPHEGEDLVLRITIDSAGQVTKIDGLAEYVAKQTGGTSSKEECAAIIEQMEADGVFREQFRRAFGFVPDGFVGAGDKWRRSVESPFWHYGVLEGAAEYTYEGPGEGGETISFTVNWHDQHRIQNPLGGFMSRATLEGAPAKGTVIFDGTAGRLVRFQQTFRVEATLEGLDLSVGKNRKWHIRHESDLTLRVLDRNPLK
jgi:hypothetical protein